MNRRNMLYAGAGVAAGLAGAGAWWAGRSEQAQAQAPAGAAQAFWDMTFDSPDGKPIAMRSFQGKLLLVNFWATWCPPCVEELPLLDFFYQENKGKNLQIVGLAVDQPSAVRAWLQTRPLNFPVGMAGLGGTDLSKSLGNLAGSLPFTAVYNPAGKLVHRKTGKVLPEELVQWIKLT